MYLTEIHSAETVTEWQRQFLYVPSGTYKTAYPEKKSIYYPSVTKHWGSTRNASILPKSCYKRRMVDACSKTDPETRWESICQAYYLAGMEIGRREISMAANVETMFYTREKPWHG